MESNKNFKHKIEELSLVLFSDHIQKYGNDLFYLAIYPKGLYSHVKIGINNNEIGAFKESIPSGILYKCIEMLIAHITTGKDIETVSLPENFDDFLVSIKHTKKNIKISYELLGNNYTYQCNKKDSITLPKHEVLNTLSSVKPNSLYSLIMQNAK